MFRLVPMESASEAVALRMFALFSHPVCVDCLHDTSIPAHLKCIFVTEARMFNLLQ